MNATIDLAPTGAPSAVVAADPVSVELQKYVSTTGLEPTAQQTLAEAFRPVFVKAHAAIAEAAGVAESVKDATCVREIKRSRDCRLAIRAVRIEGEKVHKAQKESAIRFGRAVDGFKNILLAELGPVEEALEAAEKTAERAEAARLAALKAAREAELLPLLNSSLILVDLSALSETSWQKLLADHRLLRQAKIDAVQKAFEAEVDRQAKEKAERERIESENARLKAEADATAKRLEAEQKAREEQARKEREAQEAERRRIEAERKAEREKAEVEKRALEAKAKAERLAAEAKARKECEAIQAKLAESERIAKMEHDKLEAEIARAAKAKADEARRIDTERKANEAAERRAAAAPDKAKLEALLEIVNELQLPHLENKGVRDAVIEAHEVFASTIEQLIIALTAAPASKELL